MQAIYQWFWRLLPGNPLVVRIVHNGSRRMQHLWVRMGYLGVLTVLVLIGLLSGGGMGQAQSVTDLAQAGSWLFFIIAYGQVILVCLLAPLFMAGAISAEQQGKTFDILLTTPLTNVQIVLGSLAGRVFFILALLLSGVPLFSVLLMFGGVPMRSVAVCFVVAGLTTLFVAAIAVTLSVLRAGGRKAVFTFVITVAGYVLAGFIIDRWMLRLINPGQTTVLTPLHPLLVLESYLNSANYRPPAPETLAGHFWPIRVYLGDPLAAFSLLTGGASLAMVLFSAIFVRNIGQGDGPVRQWLRKRLRLQAPGGERSRPARDVWINPIAWREANTRGKVAGGILARWAFVVIGLLGGIILLMLYHLDALPSIPGQTTHDVFESALLILIFLEIAIITLISLYMSAGCVSKEREDGTLDLMLTTPITPKYYIWGKLRGLVSFLSMMIAVPVLTLAMVTVYSFVGWALGWEQAGIDRQVYVSAMYSSSSTRTITDTPLVLWESPLLLLLMLVPFVAFCIALGMHWSLKSRGVIGAVVPSVALVGVGAVVFGLCGQAMVGSVPLLGPVINAFSPATNVLMLVDPWSNVASFGDSDASAIFSRFTLFVSAAVCAGSYVLIVWGIILNMVRGFDQTVRKLSGTG